MFKSDPELFEHTSNTRLVVTLFLSIILTPFVAIILSFIVHFLLGSFFQFRISLSGFEHSVFLFSYFVSIPFMIVPVSVVLIHMRSKNLLGGGSIVLFGLAISFTSLLVMFVSYWGDDDPFSGSVSTFILFAIDGFVSYGLVLSLILNSSFSFRTSAILEPGEVKETRTRDKVLLYSFLALLSWAIVFSFLLQNL